MEVHLFDQDKTTYQMTVLVKMFVKKGFTNTVYWNATVEHVKTKRPYVNTIF